MINSPLLGCRVESILNPSVSGVAQIIFTNADSEPCMTLRLADGRLRTVLLNDNWRVIDDNADDTAASDDAVSDPLDFKGKRVSHPEMGTGLVMNCTYVELGSAIATMQMDDGRIVTSALGFGWSIIEDGPAATPTATPVVNINSVINSTNFTPAQMDLIVVGLLRLSRGQSSINDRRAIDARISVLIEGIDGAQISMSGPDVDPAVIEPILAALGG